MVGNQAQLVGLQHRLDQAQNGSQRAKLEDILHEAMV
jgi:hypothetical protein